MDTSDIKVEVSESSEGIEEPASEIADESIKSEVDVILLLYISKFLSFF